MRRPDRRPDRRAAAGRGRAAHVRDTLSGGVAARAEHVTSPSPVIELQIERAVAGGRMLARHDGRVVLVSGAIPGERVRARVERTQGGVVFARVLEVLEASDARRDPGPDPACGGMTYAHIDPRRQHQLKSDIVVDAFARIARMSVAPPPVHAAADREYRMRVRLHVRDGRIGSFREATHEVCDVRATGQVLPATADLVDALGECLRAHGVSRVETVEIGENLDASQRVVHLEFARGESAGAPALAAVSAIPGITGVSVGAAWDPRVTAVSGVAWVDDPLSAFTGAARATAEGGPRLRRHARAFFQANRFLTPALVRQVLARLDEAPVVDLYAGVGLFALSRASTAPGHVVAVEGDPVSAADLEANAEGFAVGVRVVHASVEAFLAREGKLGKATVIVDPPRTGISREAMDAVLAAAPRRVVYVSCDVATMARDARRLSDAGYGMVDLAAFDLFPNTPHVEALASFERQRHPTPPSRHGLP